MSFQEFLAATFIVTEIEKMEINEEQNTNVIGSIVKKFTDFSESKSTFM